MLPLLREELDLMTGPVLPDGQPSWTLHDPSRNQFFRIDWPTFEVLKRWEMPDVLSISTDIRKTTTLEMSVQDVEQIVHFMVQSQLVKPAGADSVSHMAERCAHAKGSWWTWLLHHYLFFRIPLVRPDAWLQRTLSWVSPFYASTFWWVTLGALALGMVQIARQSDQFMSQLVDVFSLSGLLAYSFSLFMVKTLHELGHAYTAKRLGCRVPVMGVAFLVLWPMAYTDTNETWRLNNHRHRLQVASAGILTEMAVASWATLAWGFLPDGAMRSAVFVLATTSWIATLAINASPFMRFDGYFILSDALDMPNLHERSFAMARWKLREWLFDLREAPPEKLSVSWTRGMISFAWMTWVYRLVLFIGIALLVYHMFFKLLGLFLFLVEIAWFIMRPIRSELREWKVRQRAIRNSGRVSWSMMIFLLIIGILFVPWPSRVTASAILRPADVWPVHAPSGAVLEQLLVVDGQAVSYGSPIAFFKTPDLESRKKALVARVEQLKWQAATSGFDESTRDKMRVVQESLSTAITELGSLDAELSRYVPIAPYSGFWRGMDPDLREGTWLPRDERIGVLVKHDSRWLVETWLDEDAVSRILPGYQGIFINDGSDLPPMQLSVRSIDRDATRVLAREELASDAGGHLLVRVQGHELIPEAAIYRVTFDVLPHPTMPNHRAASITWRGRVSIESQSQAPAWVYLRQAVAVAVREMGF